MTRPAQSIIEEVYSMALNPTQPYNVQLDALSASGELSNKRQTNEILFRLCELVDKQQTEIKALQDDREDIAKRLIALQPAENTAPIVSDPTLPLDATATNPTQPDTQDAL